MKLQVNIILSYIATHIRYYPTAARHHVLALFVCLQRYKNLEFSLSLFYIAYLRMPRKYVPRSI